MTAFLDSSALVKLYVPEDGAAQVQALPAAHLVSGLARVEVPAAFWRKHRVGELTAADAAALSRGFEDDLLGSDGKDGRFSAVTVSPMVLEEAARLVAVHPLRAYDGVQLASALLAEAALQSSVLFATFDRALQAAAHAEGLLTL